MTEVAALLMAAGNSRRMGGPNKLWLPFKNTPLIVFATRAVNGAKLSARLMVTGRDHERTGKFAEECGFQLIHNPRYEQGFGTSLAAGFSALLQLPNCDGALVMLADMPLITSAHLDKMVDAFGAADGLAIIRAASNGHPGNPVIIPKALFSEMANLESDQSGQMILKTSGLPLKLVEIGVAAVADIDTPEALSALQGAVL